MTPEVAQVHVRRPRPHYARPLTPSGNLRRRQLVSRIAQGGAMASALLAVGVLGVVVFTVVQRGAAAINISFLTQAPAAIGDGGGVAPMIVGTVELVLIATAISMPIAILAALYLTEFAPARVASAVRLALDVLNGVPSIVIGLFAFGLIVVGLHHQSGFAGSLALAIIMLPLIARATQEMLLLVPGGLREAAEALGVSRWRTVLGVLLPSVLGGVLTGTVLAIARAAGETAPLLFCSSIFPNGFALNPFSGALPNIPVEIFTLSESDDPNAFTKAWGLALVLLTFILLANVAARAVYARSRRVSS
jgi:phosphate transport system permease protein